MDGRTDPSAGPRPAEDAAGTPALPPPARGPVVAVAALTGAALVWSSGRYGFFGDELYYRASGDRPAVGYPDNGPLLPLLARLTGAVAPDSLVALRLPAILCTVLAVVVTAQIARELGGGRGAQVLAATAYATSPLLVLQGQLLSSNAIDTTLWTVVTWLLVRWRRTGADRLLLAAALVTALALQVKWLIPVFWGCALVAVLVAGPRTVLRRPALALGAGIVLATSVPQLVWQSVHDWPQLALGSVVAAEQGGAAGRLLLVPTMLLSAGPLVAVLSGYGLVRLVRAPELWPYRFLGLAAGGVLVAVAVLGGRPYYPAGVLAVCLAAAAVDLCRRPLRVPRWAVLGPLAAASTVLAVLGLRPVPADDVPPAAAGGDMTVHGQFGWPELVAATGAAHRSLDAETAAGAVVVADTYWAASALDQLGHDLPPVYGTGRGFWYFGAPPETARTALLVGGERPTGFGSVRLLDTVAAPRGMPGDPDGSRIWLAEDPQPSWSGYWAGHGELRRLPDRPDPTNR